MDWLENAVSRQLDCIAAILNQPLQELAVLCAPAWNSRAHLDHALTSYLDNKTNHRCRVLYAIDADGQQNSSIISANEADVTTVGEDLSGRRRLAVTDEQDRFGPGPG